MPVVKPVATRMAESWMKAQPMRLVARLQRRHFAFMRALLQGLDERESWKRYLADEGEGGDPRRVRHTIAWIRDEFAAAARREARLGTARLVRLDPETFTGEEVLPTLESFAAERGLEDFSEAEQAEAYAEAFPMALGRGRMGSSRTRPTQRARIIARQLKALRWLESHVTREPRPEDRVETWLNSAVARSLECAGTTTLGQLVARIDQCGARWWSKVPGIGAVKAARAVAWLRIQEPASGLRPAPHTLMPHAAVPASVRAAVVMPATALVPLEKLIIPAGLDGQAGVFRAPPGHCQLRADNDHDAIVAWLIAKGDGPANPTLTATQRAYRKEAERLLLWSVLERRKPISSLTLEDARFYQAFLAQPPVNWQGKRHHQRWSPDWRPFEGPLSPAAQRQSMTVLRALFSWLTRQHYVIANPFALASSPASTPARGAPRRMTSTQWERLDLFMQAQLQGTGSRRLARAVRWLYATGLRLAEITEARCANLRCQEVSDQGRGKSEWTLVVEGRGGRKRSVRVPVVLVDELAQELHARGRDTNVCARENSTLAILARFESGSMPQPWSSSGLAKAIKALLARFASELCPTEAEQVRRASAEWLRSSHGRSS